MSGLNNVIQWADAVEALKIIAEEQKLVAGMTVAEAATALKYTATSSGMYVKTVLTAVAPSAVGATATEVVAAGTTGAVATTAVNLTLVEGAGGSAIIAGIGSIALPIAACIAAAGGGYLIGKELNKNEVYSDFFDNLVYSIGDFVTGNNLADTLHSDENTITLPLLYDEYGRAYLPSGAVSSVKDYLDTFDSEVTTSTSVFGTLQELCDYYHITDLSSHTPAGYNYLFVLCNGTTSVIFYFSNIQIVMNYASQAQYRGGAIRYDFNGASYPTYGATNSYIGIVNSLGFNNLGVLFTNENILNADGTIFVNKSAVELPDLPAPITKYTPAIDSITSIVDPTGKEWTHVILPSTNPLEMPDGEPVPEVATPYPERLSPFIKPWQPQPLGVPIVVPATTPVNPLILPNPEPDTSTAPYPAPDPATDPSQLAEPLPVSEPVEPIPKPVNAGKVPVPVVPSALSPSSAKGLLHVYNPTPTQVDLFGEWLWTTFSGDLIDTIGKLFNNPMDAVIGLHEIYCTPTESGADVNIRAGFLESTVPSRLVTSRYIEIKCGALSVPEYWGNYLDYSPYTKSYCYLPFIGIVELNTDDIVGSGVEITYRVDVYNGSCIALITTAKANSDECISYQFDGNCSVAVPITSGMMTAVQNSLMGIATTALSAATTAAITVATGGTALPAAVMVGTVAAGSAKQGLTSKNQVQCSGSFGSSFGAMGIKIPFLIIKRPKQKVVYGYNTNYGYPAHTMVLISTCSGYLRAIEVDVVSPTATEAEKKMIEQLLKSGVFVD